MTIKAKKKKILEEIREVMRLKHYSIHTERACCDWIKRFIFFHGMMNREEFFVDVKRKLRLFFLTFPLKARLLPVEPQ